MEAKQYAIEQSMSDQHVRKKNFFLVAGDKWKPRDPKIYWMQKRQF